MFESLSKRIPNRIEQEKEKVSAVLIPLIKKDDKYHILFEVRSSKLSHQPGEICFPGGKREANECSLQTAIRETCEELLIPESDVLVYGPLDYFLSPTGMRIDVYLGELKNYDGTYSSDEVSEVFTVPLEYFQSTSPKQYFNHINLQPEKNFPFDKIPFGENYPWAKGKYEVLFYEYKDHVIWGITSKILYHNLKFFR